MGETSAETNHSKHMSIQPKPSLIVVCIYIYIYVIILPSETSGFFNNPIYKESLQKKSIQDDSQWFHVTKRWVLLVCREAQDAIMKDKTELEEASNGCVFLCMNRLRPACLFLCDFFPIPTWGVKYIFG